MDELLDIINEQDEVIGQCFRSEKKNHTGGVRIVACFIFDSSGNITVGKINPLKVFGNLYSYTAAGHVSAGEDISQAAHRELKEEQGFDVPLTYVGKIINKDNNRFNSIHYIFKGIYDGVFHPDPSEYSGIKTFSPDELNQLILTSHDLFHKTFCLAWKKYFSKDKQNAQ